MEERTSRYFAVTVFGYDKATNLPIMMLIPFSMTLMRYVNNAKMIEMAQKVHPQAILLHVANIQEFECYDDLLDYIAKPPAQPTDLKPEDRGKLMKDGEPEQFFTMSQSMPGMQDLPFYDHFTQPHVCKHCQREEIDPDHFPYCGEICEIQAKNDE